MYVSSSGCGLLGPRIMLRPGVTRTARSSGTGVAVPPPVACPHAINERVQGKEPPGAYLKYRSACEAG